MHIIHMVFWFGTNLELIPAVYLTEVFGWFWFIFLLKFSFIVVLFICKLNGAECY